VRAGELQPHQDWLRGQNQQAGGAEGAGEQSQQGKGTLRHR
jgi:hypothetical protein